MTDDPLLALATHLGDLTFALSGDRSRILTVERDRVMRLVRGVVARVAAPEAPLLLVLGGGSGAGKSTTVNTLAGATVTQTGVLRPTTRVPTLVCHPDDHAWFTGDHVLPEMSRDADAPRRLRVVTSPGLPSGVGLLDTPDIDSVEVANHRLAEESLDAADAWLWLATSRTYADEVAMGYLRRARTRQALTAVAITQVRPHERDEVLADVERLLAAEGIDPDLRTDIPHAEVVDGRLPPDALEPLRRWLEDLAPPARRVAVREQASAGLRAALSSELTTLQQAVTEEARAAGRLRAAVAEHYQRVPDQLETELEHGVALRADVLDRWQRLVGGSEALVRVQTVLGQVGDVVRSGLGRPGTGDTRQVRVEVAGELTRIVDRLLDHAARGARRDLESDPVGRDLLAAEPGLRGTGDDREARVREMIAGWEDDVAERIETVGGPRKTKARRTSAALNAVATSAILVLFALSGGLTGGEVGIAAAASAASQWLLVRMLGEQNVRRLLEDIGAELTRRVGELADEEQQAFTRAIDGATPPAASVDALRAAAEPR